MNIPSHTPTAAATRLHTAIALCAAATLVLVSGGAFAQINPEVKLGFSDQVNRTAPNNKVAHNPPGYKCGHNPPDDKIGSAASTRVLLPAVKLTGQDKTLNAPQTVGTVCQKN